MAKAHYLSDQDGKFYPYSHTQAIYNDDGTLLETRLSGDETTISGKADKATTLAGYGITDAVASSEKGAASGIATLGTDGKVPSSQLPSYVDDVEEYDKKDDFPATGESGKIYVDKTTNITYRWSGTEYVAIGSDLALGETSSTAYAGDKGKAVTDLVGNTEMGTTATTVTGAIAELKSNFQAGVDGVYDAIVAQGTTPASKSLSDVETGIATLSTDRYNAGNTAGQSEGKTEYEPTAATVDKAGNISVTNVAGTSVLSTTTDNTYDSGYSDGDTAGQTTAKAEYEPTDATLSDAGVLSVTNAAGTEKYTETFTNSYDAGVTAGESSAKVGTATSAQVLTGYTFTNASTIGENGAMPNNGAVFETLDVNTKSYTIPYGYHNGIGTVSITTQTKTATPSSASQTISADVGKVLSSVTVDAITNGNLNNVATEGVTYTEDTSTTTEIPAEGSLYINEGYYPNTRISLAHLIPDDPGYENAGVSQIVAGYEAYDPNGKKLIGTLSTITPAFTGGVSSLTDTSNAIDTNMTSAETGDYYIDATAKAKATRTAVTYDGNTTGIVDQASGSVASDVNTSEEESISATRLYIATATVPNPTISIDGANVTATATYTEGYTEGGTITATSTVPSGSVTTSDTTLSVTPSVTPTATASSTGSNLTLGSVATSAPSTPYIKVVGGNSATTGSATSGESCTITKTAGYIKDGTATVKSTATASATANSKTVYYSVTGATIPKGCSFTVNDGNHAWAITRDSDGNVTVL